MATQIHPHSAQDRTKEWRSCCFEITLGRDPKRQRLIVHDDDDKLDGNDDNEDDNHISPLLGAWSSPGCLAINMMVESHSGDEDEQDDDMLHTNLDSWMKAALTLSASIDEVSLMIQNKAASYLSSTDTLNICFNNNTELNTEQTMTNADRSILETTVASFAAGMAKQIESLRQSVLVDETQASHQWASGSIGHRGGIAACLMQRLKLEIMHPMTKLQSQREKSLAKTNKSGVDASDIAQNPMRLLLGGKSQPTTLPPAPWEVGDHDLERDMAERQQEQDEFLDVYFDKGETNAGDLNTSIPLSVAKLLDLPEPSAAVQKELTPIIPKPTEQTAPQQNIPLPYNEEEEHMDQLQRESATLLATYQHSDLEGVQKVERSMVEITSLLSRFTDLITEQQEDICVIHDQALKSKENVDKGQDNLVDAAKRGEKSKHPMATFIFISALLLLFFNWILP